MGRAKLAARLPAAVSAQGIEAGAAREIFCMGEREGLVWPGKQCDRLRQAGGVRVFAKHFPRVPLQA